MVILKAKGKTYKITMKRDVVSRLNGKVCRFLAEGCRRVYKCGDYVIKVDGVQGWNDKRLDAQNFREYKKWKKIKPRDRQFFAEVIAYKKAGQYSVLIQRYIRGGTPNSYVAISKVRSLTRRYRISDVHDGYNYVIRDNKPIIYDLGC